MKFHSVEEEEEDEEKEKKTRRRRDARTRYFPTPEASLNISWLGCKGEKCGSKPYLNPLMDSPASFTRAADEDGHEMVIGNTGLDWKLCT